MYQLISASIVKRLSDGACIPLPANESEGYLYDAWLAAGNTPLPPDSESPEQLASYERAWRDEELLKADIEVNKAADTSGGAETTWRQYREALRNWPQSAGFPNASARPARPD